MRPTSDTFDRISTVVVVLAALLMTGFYIHDRGRSAPRAAVPVFVESWAEENVGGITVGRADAPVVLTEFIDFTCPYCRALVPVVDSLLALSDDQVAMVFHHFPLGRPMSLPTAIAAECADRQSHFAKMYRTLFDRIDDIQDPSWDHDGWRTLAGDLGLDVDAFALCITLPEDSFPRIARGRDIGARLGIQGTPTVWINGHIAPQRTVEGLMSVIEDNGLLAIAE